MEVYTLVKYVEPSGPAHGKLNVGDWLRSVNSTPILEAKQASLLFCPCARTVLKQQWLSG